MIHIYKHVHSLLFNRWNLQSTIQKYLTIILNGSILKSEKWFFFWCDCIHISFFNWGGQKMFRSGFSKFRFLPRGASSVFICSAFCFCLGQMATGADGVHIGSLLGLFLRRKIILFYSRHTASLTNGSLSKMWELGMCQDETTHMHTKFMLSWLRFFLPKLFISGCFYCIHLRILCVSADTILTWCTFAAHSFKYTDYRRWPDSPLTSHFKQSAFFQVGKKVYFCSRIP